MTAPTKPTTYEEALAASKQLQAAANTPPDPAATVTAMSEQIIAARDKSAEFAKTQIQRLWSTVNPYSDRQVKAFAAQAAQLMESAQAAAARVAAAGQSKQLASLGIPVNAAPAVPVDVRAPAAVIKRGQLRLDRAASTVTYTGPGDGVKVSTADMSTRAIFERPAETYRYVVSKGGVDAAKQASDRIDSLIDDNLMLSQRLAQQQVLAQAVNLDDNGNHRGKHGVKVIGYRRVIHPEQSRGGTCGMCIAASDRIYKVAQLMPIHAHCKCTIAPVTEDHDPADDVNAVDLRQLYKHAGGNTGAHLKRTRYQVDEHGELGPVLVPKSKYKPRSDKSKRRAGGNAGIDSKPESKADVASRHLPLLEKSLADLRARGVAEDSSQVIYHKDQIERLRNDLSRTASGGPAQPKKPVQARKPDVPPKPGGGSGGGGGGDDGGRGRNVGGASGWDDEWNEEERSHRQNALGIEANGERLTGREIMFVESLQRHHGGDIEWISRDYSEQKPTNDFIWKSNGGLRAELKSTVPRYGTIAKHIRDAVKKARAQDVVKDNFVIDIGPRALSPKLRTQLSAYNRRNPDNRVARLWVMSSGGTKLDALGLD
jgi:hypothetical protein